MNPWTSHLVPYVADLVVTQVICLFINTYMIPYVYGWSSMCATPRKLQEIYKLTCWLHIGVTWI